MASATETQVEPQPGDGFRLDANLEGIDEAAAAIVEGTEQFLSEANTAYMATLRVLATARHADSPADRASWRPTPEGVAAVDAPGAERISRYVAMGQNVAAYSQRLRDIGLRDDQLEPFELLLNFMGSPSQPGEHYNTTLREVVANVVGGGFNDLPTGSGKTGLMAHAALAVGIGNRLSANPESRPLKGITLVPSLEILKQTQGEAVQEGYAKFAPELKTSLYYGEQKDLEGDMVIMTYQSFIQAVNKGQITRDMFDIVFADEAHHLLAKETRAALELFCGNELQVIGFTATSEYSDDRKLSEVLHRKICEIHIRDLVELGVLSAVQLLAVATDHELHASGTKGDFTESELRGLMYSQNRNEQIIDWIEAMVLDGRQVLTYALRGKGPEGESCWHAHHIEKLAAARGMTIKALDSTSMTQAQIDKILDDWDNGRIDGVVVVDKLREGWSSIRVGAVVEAAPTASKVVEWQRTGRGTRLNEDQPVTVYVTFVDKVYGGKEQITPWHVFGESIIDPQKIIGRVPTRKGTGTGGQGGTRDPRTGAGSTGDSEPETETSTKAPDTADDDNAGTGFDTSKLSQNLADQLDVPYTVIDELVIRSKLEGEDYRYPTEEEVPLVDTVQWWRRMETPTVVKLLEANGFSVVLARGPRGPQRYVHRDAATFLEHYKIPPIATANQYTAHEAAPVIGLVAYSTVQKLAERLGIQPVILRTKGQRMLRPHYNEPDVLRMAAVVKEMRTFHEGDEAIAAIAADYKLFASAILHYATSAKPPIDTDNFKYLPTSGKRAAVVDMYDAARIRMHFETTLVTKTNGRKTREMLAAELELSPGTVARVAKAAGIALTGGRLYDEGRGRFVGVKFWQPPEVAAIKELITGRGEMSINALLTDLERQREAAKTAAVPSEVPQAVTASAGEPPADETPGPQVVDAAASEELTEQEVHEEPPVSIADIIKTSGRAPSVVQRAIAMLGLSGRVVDGALPADAAAGLIAALGATRGQRLPTARDPAPIAPPAKAAPSTPAPPSAPTSSTTTPPPSPEPALASRPRAPQPGNVGLDELVERSGRSAEDVTLAAGRLGLEDDLSRNDVRPMDVFQILASLGVREAVERGGAHPAAGPEPRPATARQAATAEINDPAMRISARDAATQLGCTTSALYWLVNAQPKGWQLANREDYNVVDVHINLLGPLGAALRRTQMTLDQWMSHAALAKNVGVPETELLAMLSQRGIAIDKVNTRDYRVARGSGKDPYYATYSPFFWQRVWRDIGFPARPPQAKN